MKQLTAMEAELIRVALTKMFQPSAYFNYCTIERICELTGVIPPKRTLDTLHLIHCVHWNEMPEGARQAVFETVLGLFQHDGFDLGELQQIIRPPVVSAVVTLQPEATHRSFLQRWLA